MSALLRWSLATAFLLSGAALSAQDKGKDEETVENPYYKFWSKSKVGASVDLKETTKLAGEAGAKGANGKALYDDARALLKKFGG